MEVDDDEQKYQCKTFTGHAHHHGSSSLRGCGAMPHVMKMYGVRGNVP